MGNKDRKKVTIDEGNKFASVSKSELSELGTKEIKTAQERCRLRYLDSRTKYNNYFLKCLEDIEALQPSAFAGVQVSRMFTVGVLPKYCKIQDPLTRKQRKRLEQIIQEVQH